MSTGTQATTADAQALMQLYDLRREPTLRAARKFMISEFWPQSYDEFKALMFEFGSERNAFARQCLTYWDMAAAMVLHGTINEDLFFDANGEPYFLFAKFGAHVIELRKEWAMPNFLSSLEQLANHPKGQERVKLQREWMGKRQAAAAAARAAKQSQ
jgi:hypothetical protein